MPGAGPRFGIAEGEFIGGGVSIYFFLPILSVQGGVEVEENLVLRGNLDSILLANVLTVDVLYTFFDQDYPVND